MKDTIHKLADKSKTIKTDVISNSRNRVSDRCKSCKHLQEAYGKCTKSGTCIYDLAKLADQVFHS